MRAPGAGKAAGLGVDRDDHYTEFGPIAVDLHEVAVAAELGDAGTAIRLAGKIDRERLSPGRHGMDRATPGLGTSRSGSGWTRRSSNRCRPVPVRRAAAYAPPAVRA
ncbi:hypothetical protein [Nocardia fusca]|uniref:Uncharacterized protein n=1 Tax=Nocardia fusca TaxID=941183 RepID=A0ABV3FFL8_9NOCA